MKTLLLFATTFCLGGIAHACVEPAHPSGYAVGIVDSIRFEPGQAVYRLQILESQPPPGGTAEVVTPLAYSVATFTHPETGQPRHAVGSSEWLYPKYAVETIGLDLGMPVLVTYYDLCSGKRVIAQRYVVWDDSLPHARDAQAAAADADAIRTTA